MLNPIIARQIHYVIVHPTPRGDEQSPFQGYGSGLLETVGFFETVATLPLDLLDFGRDWQAVLANRINSAGSGVTPLQLDALQAFFSFNLPFVCVCSHPSVGDEVDQMIAAAARPILHVRYKDQQGAEQKQRDNMKSAEQSGGNPIALHRGGSRFPLSYESLFEYCAKVLDHLDASGGAHQQLGSMFRVDLGTPQATRRVSTPIGLSYRQHFVTAANELALEAVGLALGGLAMHPPHTTAEFSDAILESALALQTARRSLLSGSAMLRFMRSCDLVVALPSLFAHWYRGDAHRFGRGSRFEVDGHPARLLRDLTKAFTSQTDYTLQLPVPVGLAVTRGGAAGLLVEVRRNELSAFSAQLALRASADAAPVVRLLPNIAQLREPATRFASAARRGAGPNRDRKLQRFARAFSKAVAATAPFSLLPFIDTLGAPVKLIGDAALEWMSVGATPLMLRASCSRVPSTPGNSSFALCVGGHEKFVPLSAFSEVLIIRSYSPQDPIRNVLVGTVTAFLHEAGARIAARVVDVTSVDEFEAALTSFEGALLIFDGHGRSGSSRSAGTLRIGSNDVDLISMRGRVRIPPICVLSACDTHALDGSHATPAHALLMSGADTVVATSLPVDAHYAAMFVSRLLYRIDTFLPLALGGPHGVARWSQVVPGLQKMSYATEMLRAIDGANGIALDAASRLRVGFIANTYINISPGDRVPQFDSPLTSATNATADLYLRAIVEERERLAAKLGSGTELEPTAHDYPEWLDATLERIAKDTGVARSIVNDTVRERAWVTDALKYIELGNPERLLVVRDPD